MATDLTQLLTEMRDAGEYEQEKAHVAHMINHHSTKLAYHQDRHKRAWDKSETAEKEGRGDHVDGWGFAAMHHSKRADHHRAMVRHYKNVHQALENDEDVF